jgi:molybdopterin-containing oxidoreductase family membrane subunit
MENINRSAEAMTIFSVIQAGLFPIIHGSSMVSVLVLPIQINLDLFG